MSEQNTGFKHHPKSTFIYSVVEHMDDFGRRVVFRDVVCGTPPEDFIRFVGLHQINVVVDGGPPQPTTYRFPIEKVETLEQAFEAFDANAEVYGIQYLDQLRAQMRGAPSGLIIPDAQTAKKVLHTGP